MRCDHADLAKTGDIDQSTFTAPTWRSCQLLGRAPQRNDFRLGAGKISRADRAQRRAGKDNCPARVSLALGEESRRLEAMMQRQRAASEEPWQQRRGEP